MNNFIFKSPKRLIKNSTINFEDMLSRKLDLILEQNRNARQDFVDVKLMINKLLIDKHLQMQVDEYFEDNKQEDSRDLD